jgi:ubiquinone/menaquinone biosynthesis C-methylase UbiE
MDVYSRHVNGFPDICPNIKFINSDAESIPLEDNRFDIIVCVNALDHFNDVLTSIKEMERLLKYDGLLLLNVDCKDRNKDNAQKRVGHPYSLTKDKLQQLFTHTSLELIFEKSFSELSSLTMHFRKKQLQSSDLTR